MSNSSPLKLSPKPKSSIRINSSPKGKRDVPYPFPSSSYSTKARANYSPGSPPLSAVVVPAEFPLREATAEAQGDAGRSPLVQPVASSEVVPPTLPPSLEETPPPPVVDSTAGNPGAFIHLPDVLPQPDVVQDPQAVAVAPVEPATLSPTEIITEAPLDELTSYVEPLTESIRDLEPVDHTDETASLIYMPLPPFDDVIASIPIHSMPSLKNGNTGNLIETESVFFPYFHDLFCLISLIYSLLQRKTPSSFSPGGQAIQAYTIVLSSKMSA
jgi:hypothetical protein